MPYFLPIYRATEYNLRRQIMDHLQYLIGFGLSKTVTEAGDNPTIPAGYQMLVYRDMTIGPGSNMTIEGELIVLGGVQY